MSRVTAFTKQCLPSFIVDAKYLAFHQQLMHGNCDPSSVLYPVVFFALLWNIDLSISMHSFDNLLTLLFTCCVECHLYGFLCWVKLWFFMLSCCFFGNFSCSILGKCILNVALIARKFPPIWKWIGWNRLRMRWTYQETLCSASCGLFWPTFYALLEYQKLIASQHLSCASCPGSWVRCTVLHSMAADQQINPKLLIVKQTFFCQGATTPTLQAVLYVF